MGKEGIEKMKSEFEPVNKDVNTYAMWNPEKRLQNNLCPICKSTEREYLQDVRPIGGDCLPFICKQCGFITYSQVPDLEKYYQEEARPQTLHFQQTKKNKMEFHRNLLVKWVKELDLAFDIRHVLDFGCSDGYMNDVIKEFKGDREYEYLGIESNKGHRNWGTIINGYNIIEKPNEVQVHPNHDLIILYHVLEHIYNPVEFMQWIKSHLQFRIYRTSSRRSIMNDTGVIYLALPTFKVIEYAGFSGDASTFFKDEHINIFTPELLEEMLESLGLAILKKEYHEYGSTYLLTHELTDRFNLKVPTEVKPITGQFGYKATKERYDKYLKASKLRQEAINTITRDREHAVMLIKQAIDLYGDDWQQLHIDYVSMVDPLDAEDYILDMVEKFKDIPKYFNNWKMMLVQLYFRDKEYEKCEILLDELLTSGRQTTMVLQLQRDLFYHLGKRDRFVEVAKRLISMYPDNQSIVDGIGLMLTKI
jgi:2-polyprenyl-3-methyl-5-hydroxy-6-metoxy-1,4-benzoquinol methylase